MRYVRTLIAVAAFLIASPALAQWQVSKFSVPIGQGSGVQGFGAAAPGVVGLPFVSNGANAAPSFQVLPNSGLAPMPADTVKCNPTGSAAAVQDCTNPIVAGLTINPTTSTLNQGLNINQTVAGTTSANPYGMNNININDTTAAGVVGLLTQYAVTVWPGSTFIQKTAVQNAAFLHVRPSASGQALVAESATAEAIAGVDTNNASLFATNFSCYAAAGSKGNACLGGEIDITIATGSTWTAAIGLQIINTGPVAGTGGGDVAFLVGNTPGSAGWDRGFGFYNNSVKTAGTILGMIPTASMTVTHGIDLATGITCSLDCFKSTGFAVDPIGGVYHTALHAVGSSSGAAVVSPQAVAGSAALVWGTDSGTIAASVASPLTQNTTTGKISCSTCAVGTITSEAASAIAYYSGATTIAGVSLTGLVLGNGASAPTAYGGTSSAGNVLTALSAAGVGTFLPYASINTVSTLVQRDGSGNFSAGTITASLTGHSSLDLALTGGTMSGSIAMGGGNISGGGTFTATSLAGTLTTAAQGNITSLGTITSLLATAEYATLVNIGAAASGQTWQQGFLFTVHTAGNFNLDLLNVGSANAFYSRNDANNAFVPLSFTSSGTSILGTGGLQIGTPTGGDKGAGTLNPSGAYYANGTKGVTCSGALTVVSSITIASGIITAAAGTGGTCS